MTDSTPSPIVTNETQAPVVDSPIVVDDVVPEEPVKAAEPAPDLTKSQPEWAIKRINELTFKRHEAERLAQTANDARLAAEAKTAELLTKLAAGKPTEPTVVANPVVTEEEIDRRVSEKALQIAQANRFNEACNNIVEVGKREFKDWDDTIRNLTLVGAIGKDVPADFLETAIELKDPHKILHHLGKNLEEAEKLTKLPPKRMAMEMARIEASLNTPPVVAPVSNAPAPVITVGGAAKAGTPSIDDPSISMDDFVILRAKQKEDRQKRYQRY